MTLGPWPRSLPKRRRKEQAPGLLGWPRDGGESSGFKALKRAGGTSSCSLRRPHIYLHPTGLDDEAKALWMSDSARTAASRSEEPELCRRLDGRRRHVRFADAVVGQRTGLLSKGFCATLHSRGGGGRLRRASTNKRDGSGAECAGDEERSESDVKQHDQQHQRASVVAVVVESGRQFGRGVLVRPRVTSPRPATNWKIRRRTTLDRGDPSKLRSVAGSRTCVVNGSSPRDSICS